MSQDYKAVLSSSPKSAPSFDSTTHIRDGLYASGKNGEYTVTYVSIACESDLPSADVLEAYLNSESSCYGVGKGDDPKQKRLEWIRESENELGIQGLRDISSIDLSIHGNLICFTRYGLNNSDRLEDVAIQFMEEYGYESEVGFLDGEDFRDEYGDEGEH